MSSRVTGTGFDVDGFSVEVDGAPVIGVGLNDSAAITLPAGTHSVALSDVAANCAWIASDRREVIVTRAATARAEFSLTCSALEGFEAPRIVYAQRQGRRSSLATVDPATGETTVLTSGHYDYGPDVSPDGRRILFMRVFHHLEEDRPGIYVLEVGTRQPTELVWAPAYDPRWSPDGTELVFSSSEGWRGRAILIASIDGGRVASLAPLDSLAEHARPRWSPDGSEIAFTRHEAPSAGIDPLSIWAVRRDRSGIRRLTDPMTGDHPVWAPDGRLAYVRYTEGRPAAIRILAADGNGFQDVLDIGARPTFPWDWSPDGKLLLLTRDGDVYLLRVADGALSRVTAGRAWNGSPTFWRGGS